MTTQIKKLHNGKLNGQSAANGTGVYELFIAIKDPDEPKNLWTVWSDDSKAYEASDVEEEIKNIAWNYVDHCGKCGSCGGGKHKVVFGKHFDSVCGCTFRVDNPTAFDLPFLKKMVELRKNEILNNVQNATIC